MILPIKLHRPFQTQLLCILLEILPSSANYVTELLHPASLGQT